MFCTWRSLLLAVLSEGVAADIPPVIFGDALEAGAALAEHGAVLWKKQAACAQTFRDAAIAAWNASGHSYGLSSYNDGGSVLRPETSIAKVNDVAAGARADKPVGMHCEKAYMSQIPHFVAFGCLQPAPHGGEVQLSNVRNMADFVPSDLLNKLRTVGLEYLRRYGDEVLTPWWSYPTGTWQQRFATSDWEEAQERARRDTQLGGLTGTRLEEDVNHTVLLRWRAAAFALDPEGVESMVNGILDSHKGSAYAEGLFPLHCRFADGSEFAVQELQLLRDAVGATSLGQVRMQSGDVLVLNNFRFSHGREPYSGPRHHLSLMSEAVPRGLAAPQPFGRDEL